MTHYRLAFNGSIYEKQSNALRLRVGEIIARKDFGDLTIMFSSNGGSTEEGVGLYNFMRELPVPIHMHAVGHIGSMGVPVFLAGGRRTATPISRFFFHPYHWSFEGKQTCTAIEEASIQLDNDIALCRRIAERHCSFPVEILSKLYSRNPIPTIYTPDEALEFGLIEEVIELNPQGIVQQDVALWTVSW